MDGTLTTKVVMNKDNDKATAVMVKTEAITTSNYMYVIDYLRTNSKGDVYQVYLDGSVQEITTNGSSTTRYEGGYTFTVNGDGLYDIKQPTTVTAGTVSLKDGSALVVSGTEYDISDAEIVLIDGEDSAPSSVGEKDTVVVVYETSSGNADKALAVYVVEEYDEDNTGATMKPNANLIRQSADDDNKVKFDILGANPATVLNDIVLPYGATARFVQSDSNGDYTTTPVAGSFNVGDIVYLEVKSESEVASAGDGEISYYKCKVVSADPDADLTATEIADMFNAGMNTVTVTGSVSGVTVPATKTLVLTGDITGGTVSNSGTVKLADGATVKGNVTIAGNVTLAGDVNVATGKLDISGATLTPAADTVINVANGASLKVTIGGDPIDSSDLFTSGAFSIAANGDGGFDLTINGAASIKDTLTIDTKDTLTLGANANVNVESGADIAGSGTITAADGAKITVTAALTATSLSSIDASGTWTCTSNTWSK